MRVRMDFKELLIFCFSLKEMWEFLSDPPFLTFQLFKSLHVQLEMRRKQLEQSLQSTQRDGILTVDQALVKQAWERVSNTVRGAGSRSLQSTGMNMNTGEHEHWGQTPPPSLSLLTLVFLTCGLYFSFLAGTSTWTGRCLLPWMLWDFGCMRQREHCDKRWPSTKHTTWQQTPSTQLWSTTRLANQGQDVDKTRLLPYFELDDFTCVGFIKEPEKSSAGLSEDPQRQKC